MAFERWPAASGSTYDATVTASASNNTKGSYTELSPAIGIDTCHWQIGTIGITAARAVMMDLSIGAAASEVVQLADMYMENFNNVSVFAYGLMLCTSDIPTGTRVAARIQSNLGSTTCSTSFYAQSGTLAGRPLPVTYGADTANTKGVDVDPGASINTKGAYSQITASTTADHTRITAVAGVYNATPSSARTLSDIATGAAASEVVLIANQLYRTDNVVRMVTSDVSDYEVTVASGTRLSIRSQCTINDATDRLLRFELIGQTAPVTGGGEHSSVF